ncbi:MAG: DNA-binding response regulator [Deltaproteobacteria bacterium CG_4_8_14_3_um_filter_51_11]|nr:MAG: DNA-binding response regulator [Deltaproteobacteria bacterium CG23_combo_of_CG06-09_8_20_14_all_51_20]PIW01589.1 MAG: DNA-binding response regulator [Deltaproteobacteria bacterium CG17_big_fil_post_rev_8_21_14_2_50_51_6]PIX20059.1 MAG: DNA-binding response regulator [Deltaproteobacteria bacterium CG_4_8_14_3_um_filter_51_11]PIY21828.1 MAG: DNA-binding response regulator [Deltaproteobacteria bacterium CG_4_10_14_3_um_filter_51_14]PJB36982.1 MAG: DNA-binding response regulator [Deltaprote
MDRRRILIADDHRVVMEGIKSLLTCQGSYLVVGEAVNGQQAVDLANKLRPDIVIMDISMPGVDGVEATSRIKKTVPDVKIIIYTMHSDQRFILELFKAGISGHVLKEGPTSELLKALDNVSLGKTYFPRMKPEDLIKDLVVLRHEMDDQGIIACLSSREREIFRLLANGQRIKSIAEKLYISPKTVETHKYNIMDKLGVGSVIDLTKLAIKMHLIEI